MSGHHRKHIQLTIGGLNNGCYWVACYLLYRFAYVSIAPEGLLAQWIRELEQRMRPEPHTQAAGHESVGGQEISHRRRPLGHPQTDNADADPTSRNSSLEHEISNALRQTAQLMRALAESEESLANLYNEISRRDLTRQARG